MIFFVDPMSSGNLEKYDINLLNNIKNIEIYFFGNSMMKSKINNRFLIYEYNRKKGRLSKLFSYIKSQFKLLYYINKYRPKLIHFQWFKVPHFDYIILNLIKLYGIKIIYTAHNKLPHDTGEKYKSIYQKIYDKVDKIIVHTTVTKKEITKEFNILDSKIEVIPHGIIKFSNKRISKIDINNFKNDYIYIGFLGNISYYKGIDYLVNSWIKFEKNAKNKRLKLIIAGKGYIPKVDELIKSKNVIINNKLLSDEEFYHYLKISDVIVLPYREISQSGLLSNALAERKVIIAVDKGGLSEPYKLFKLGWLIKKNDIEDELYKIFKEINYDPKIINKKNISAEKWEELERYYSWEIIGEKTLNLYLKVLNKP